MRQRTVARTLQWMACVRSGQALAWPLFLTGVSVVAPGSSVTDLGMYVDR